VTTHSDTLTVFLQLQSWLCVGVFCKRMIFCVSYMRMEVLRSLIIVTVKVWTVTVTSPLFHINNCDLLSKFLLVTVKQAQKRKKVVNRRTLMVKQLMYGVKLI